jgi:hypothetical protein
MKAVRVLPGLFIIKVLLVTNHGLVANLKLVTNQLGYLMGDNTF